MDVHVSPFACWYIRRRGGQLYVWSNPLGGNSGSALLRHSTSKPPVGVEFRSFERDGLTVWFERGLDLSHVEIRWALLGIAVEWPSTISVV
jgi:hypothetical protein